MNHIECCLQEKEISCTRNRVKVILRKSWILGCQHWKWVSTSMPRGPHETGAGEADTAGVSWAVHSADEDGTWPLITSTTICIFQRKKMYGKPSKATSQDAGFYSPLPTSSLLVQACLKGSVIPWIMWRGYFTSYDFVSHKHSSWAGNLLKQLFFSSPQN